MTKFLIRLFIKDKDNVTNTNVRTSYGNLAGIVGIICNVLLFAGKYLVGTLFGSVAIAADAINNLSDASSNIVSLLGFKLGSRKPDTEHPYGHGRYEYLAGLVVCVIILAIGISLAKESVGKIMHPTEVAFSWLSILVLVISIGVKFWMYLFNHSIGKIIKSDTLIAAAISVSDFIIFPMEWLNKYIQNFTPMEITRTRIESQLKATSVGCMIFPTLSFAREIPIARIITHTTSPARYS